MATSRREFIKVAGAAAVAPMLLENGTVRAQETDFRRIATEETFAIPEYLEAMTEAVTNDPGFEPGWLDYVSGEFPFYNKVIRQIVDFDGERLEIMDAAGIDVAVLSLWSPGVQNFGTAQAAELAALSNDRLAEAIERHPTRYGGLAAVAPQNPEGAAQELERAVKSLDLNGFLINSHTNSEFLDDQKFWPILESAVANDVPFYLHPRRPPAQMAPAFTDYQLSGALWGFAIETSTHVIRMIMAGVFDQFPDLRIVLGHMGEGIPFWLHRLDTISGRSTGGAVLKRKPSEVFRENFSITTSGMSWEPILNLSVDVLGADNIMFATDYPFGSYEQDVAWLDGVNMPDADKALIYSGTAERVFGLTA